MHLLSRAFSPPLFHFLGETGPAVANARKQEVESYAPVVSHAAAHTVYVRAQARTDIRYFVNEGYLGGEHGVRRVLGHFGAPDVHNEDGLARAHERRVEVLHECSGPRIVRA